MACKIFPEILVDRIVLKENPIISIDARISGINIDALKNEALDIYFNAVCVLSIYDPATGVLKPTPEEALVAKIHWKYTDWYAGPAPKDYLRAQQVSIISGVTIDENDEKVKFEIDMSSLLPLFDVNQTQTGPFWGSASYLSYFTYIQIDTKQMAEDYGINIATTYQGMSGPYLTGPILVNGVLADNVQDLRSTLEEVPVC